MNNLDGKIILAHACLFDANDDKEYRGDSQKVCSIANDNDRINILEIDIRKSKDGVLYCYHGDLFEYYVLLYFFKKPIAHLRKRYRVNTLAAILDVVDERKTIFLDIKDTDITKGDILKVFRHRTFKEVLLGNKSPRFLRRFHGMPACFVKMFNGNVFCNFYDPQKLKKDNFKYFEVVFPFQITRKIIQKVHDAGLEFRCSGMFFLSDRNYWKKVEKFGIKHITSDYIEDNLVY